jgi:hypothetical protein
VRRLSEAKKTGTPFDVGLSTQHDRVTATKVIYSPPPVHDRTSEPHSGTCNPPLERSLQYVFRIACGAEKPVGKRTAVGRTFWIVAGRVSI